MASWHNLNGNLTETLLLLLSHFSCVQLCVTTRLPHPWDSPGKNTGVGCHFLLQCMKVKSERAVAQLCPTLCDPMDCSLPGSSMGFARQEYWSGVPLPSLTETLLVDFQFLLPSLMSSGASGKEPACQCRRLRDTGLIPETGRSTGVGNGNPPQYSCLGNPMDRRTWWVPSNTTEVT